MSRGDGVDVLVKRLRDFRKGQLSPYSEQDDLTLLLRKFRERALHLFRPLSLLNRIRIPPAIISIQHHGGFAFRSPASRPEHVQRGTADGGVEQRQVSRQRARFAFPKLHETRLHRVFRVGSFGKPLPNIK